MDNMMEKKVSIHIRSCAHVVFRWDLTRGKRCVSNFAYLWRRRLQTSCCHGVHSLLCFIECVDGRAKQRMPRAGLNRRGGQKNRRSIMRATTCKCMVCRPPAAAVRRASATRCAVPASTP